MTPSTVQAAPRPRDLVSIAGRDAAAYLNRMVSNEVLALPVGEVCEALLLTAKARIIAPLVVWRRADDDFLLLTEPGLGAVVVATLVRSRVAARCTIERAEGSSTLLLGMAEGGVPNRDYGIAAVEVIDESVPDGVQTIAEEELERLRIRAGSPRWGAELDETVLPAEAGLDERAISFTKGCYPGQEPVARLRHRGRVNRSLRVLAIEAAVPPSRDTPVRFEGKDVGRITSAVCDPEHGVVALAYVRREVPADGVLEIDGAEAQIIG